MEVLRGFPDNLDISKPSFVALGNFDGVHVGHRKLIGSMVSKAKEVGARSIVISFDPHPDKVISPRNFKGLLVPLQHKIELLAQLNVDILVLLPFDEDMLHLSCKEFVEDILKKYFNPSAIFVGFNYSFGYKGIGTPELLQEYGQRLNFKVNIVHPVIVDGKIVSSTYIRTLLQKGNIEQSKKCLGYWPVIEGKVIGGDKVARMLGYPTANILPQKDVMLPASGVYGGKVVKNDLETSQLAIANIGVRPTFCEGKETRIEIHLLDFKGNLYGDYIRFYINKRIREEVKFECSDALKEQIQKDIDCLMANNSSNSYCQID